MRRVERFLRVGRFMVCCDFRRVLEALDALEDRSLLPAQRVDTALRRLLLWPRGIWLLRPSGRAALMQEVLQRLTYFHGGGGERVIDFTKDFGYLYAAFLQCYGIDLTRRRPFLSWKQFCYLLLSLPPDAKPVQIVTIRSRSIPDQTAANAEQIAALRRAKRFFSLQDPDAEPMAGLAALFHTFSRQE